MAQSLVLGAAGEVRALRSLGAGLARAPGGGGAGLPAVSEHRAEAAGSARAATPGLAAKSAARPHKENEEEYSYTYEDITSEEEAEESREVHRETRDRGVKEEQEGESKADKRKESRKESEKGKDRREKESPKESRREASRRDKQSEADKEKVEEGKKKKKGKRKQKRGGRKHQRLGRLVENPHLVVHRRLPDHILQERPGLERPRREETPRDGRGEQRERSRRR